MAEVRIIDIPGLVWSADAPTPALFATERRKLFCFETTDEHIRIAELVRCVCVRFGFPNDEVQHGNPVWGRGLHYYAVHEVLGSPWLDELRRTEAVHPMAPAAPFPAARHFVLAFHDSTLEAAAESISVIEEAPTHERAYARMLGLVGEP